MNHLATHPIHLSAAQGFQASADAYERGRPEYPEQAVKHLATELGLSKEESLSKVVVDLGAGTGKFTRLLRRQTQAKIVAVEPVEAMRKKFVSVLYDQEILDGTAEKIPFSDESADAVVVAAAFHWFDGPRALKEIYRILKPEGRLGLIWNIRDESTPWVAALSEIVHPYRGTAPSYRSQEWRKALTSTPLFSKLKSAEYSYSHASTPEKILDRVASISFISALPKILRDQVLDEVQTLLNSNPDTKGRTQIEFPYQTALFWCERRSVCENRCAPSQLSRDLNDSKES